MSYNGSGTFVINTAGQPVVPNTVISSTAFNALTADLANGLSTCITKDGQTTPTANIPMGNNKITGLAAGTAGTDAANLSQVQGSTAKLLQSVTGTDTITAAMIPALTTYTAGQMFYFVAAGNNTGPVTINIDSLGAKSVTRDGSTALVSGDIVSGEIALIVYDGTRFQLLNGNSFTNLNVSNNLTLSGSTANGVLYLNASKVATSGSALTFNGSNTFTVIPSTGTAYNRTESTQYSTWIQSGAGNGSVFWEYSASTPVRWVDTSAGEQMRLNSTGLGIGTASPASRLTIYDNAPAFTMQTSRSFTTNRNWQIGVDTFTEGNWTLTPSTTLGGNTYTTPALTVDPSGNLGLGVTPSAWNTGWKAVQVGSLSSLSDSSAVTYVGNNFYQNTSSNNIYLTSNYASLYGQTAGQHIWYNAPSGTAGNTITFTQAMVLDASGNMGIGTSSPAYRLDVAINGTGPYIARFYNSSTSTTQYNVVRFGQGASGSAGGYIGTGGSAVGNVGFQNTFVVGTDTANDLVFATNDIQRARITSGGRFLVGTTTSTYPIFFSLPSDSGDWFAKFHNTQSTSPFGLVINYTAASPNGTSNEFLYCGDNASGGTQRASIRSNGGVANYQTNDVNLSDERVKTDIAPLGSMWAKIKALEIVTFKYKDQTHDDDNIGLIAQQVEAVAPEFVDADGWGETPEDGVPLKSIYTADMYHGAIKALQEAMARIESLEAKVSALEAK